MKIDWNFQDIKSLIYLQEARERLNSTAGVC